MAGWNNKNCCCTAKAYDCKDGAVAICCVTLEVSTWAHVLTAYSKGVTADDICGYTSSSYPSNNYCGYTTSLTLCSGGSRDGVPEFIVHWGVQADGTVTLKMEVYPVDDGEGNSSVLVSHTVTGLDRLTWYTTPITFTVSGVTYTISVCPDPHEPFPEWPITDVFLEMRGTFGSLAIASGNLLCGDNCRDNDPYQIRWSYSIFTDKIIIEVFYRVSLDGLGGSALYQGKLLVDYDSGNWASATHTITLTTGSPGLPDATVTVLPATSCDIPPPPPPCDPYSCFPECLVKFCDPDVNANALFLDVTSLNGCCLNGSYSFTWDGVSSYYSGKIGDQFLITCGYVEIWYECVGDQFRRRVKVTDVDGGTIEPTENDPGACSGTPENFIDSFDVPSSFLFYTGTVTFDVYTNN